jgi:predicted dehydrogenase
MSKPLRVGLIGCGFMGRAHSNAYRQVAQFFPDLEHRPVLQAVCARDPGAVSGFRDVWGYASAETDWRRLVDRDDIDLVDICAPNHMHCEMALAAAGRGKMILCEKPLAMDGGEADRMVAAVEQAGVPTMVWYNYRRVPSVTLARRLVDQGRIGRPFHYRAQFLQDWTMSEDVPQGGRALWRLDARSAGSGVTGDLLAHCIDTAIWLNGPITRVCADAETFIRQRMHQESGELEPVTIDDACTFMCRFANGSMGSFESTRYARGHKAGKTFELNGADGSLRFDLEQSEYLDFFEYRGPDGRRTGAELAGWRRIHVTSQEHPYMARWWVPGLGIGYEHSFTHALADFLLGLERGEPAQPDFRAALETQRVCDAVLRSAGTGQWETTGAEA